MNVQRDDLLARIRGMHALWQRGVADLTVEHVNHVERSGVLPIAFTLIHCVRSEDAQGKDLLDAGPLLWDAHASRLGVTGTLPWGRGTPVAVAEHLRIRDMDAWRAYQLAVFDRTETALARFDPARLDDPWFDGGRPATLAGGFLGAYVTQGAITRRNVLEAFVFQHGSRHLGELEHARALVGLTGLS